MADRPGERLADTIYDHMPPGSREFAEMVERGDPDRSNRAITDWASEAGSLRFVRRVAESGTHGQNLAVLLLSRPDVMEYGYENNKGGNKIPEVIELMRTLPSAGQARIIESGHISLIYGGGKAGAAAVAEMMHQMPPKDIVSMDTHILYRTLEEHGHTAEVKQMKAAVTRYEMSADRPEIVNNFAKIVDSRDSHKSLQFARKPGSLGFVEDLNAKGTPEAQMLVTSFLAKNDVVDSYADAGQSARVARVIESLPPQSQAQVLPNAIIPLSYTGEAEAVARMMEKQPPAVLSRLLPDASSSLRSNGQAEAVRRMEETVDDHNLFTKLTPTPPRFGTGS